MQESMPRRAQSLEVCRGGKKEKKIPSREQRLGKGVCVYVLGAGKSGGAHRQRSGICIKCVCFPSATDIDYSGHRMTIIGPR